MFDTSWVAGLDAGSACVAVQRTQDELREREWTELVLAAHWAQLHGPEGAPSDPAPMRGSQRFRPAGGHGTPEVGEFGCAELGLLMGTGFISASSLVRDAADLRHRHPRLWAALGEGKARVWKARQVARLVHAAGPDPGAGVVRGRRDHGVCRCVDLVGVHPAGGGEDHRGRPGRGRAAAAGGVVAAVRGHRPRRRARPEAADRPRRGR